MTLFASHLHHHLVSGLYVHSKQEGIRLNGSFRRQSHHGHRVDGILIARHPQSCNIFPSPYAYLPSSSIPTHLNLSSGPPESSMPLPSRVAPCSSCISIDKKYLWKRTGMAAARATFAPVQFRFASSGYSSRAQKRVVRVSAPYL